MSLSTGVLLVYSVLWAQGVPAPPMPVPSPQTVVPPRDVVRRPEPVGTGVIRGRVVAGDTGAPLRRANVNLQPIAPPLPPPGVQPATPPPAVARVRSTTTDSMGRFEFSGLPAGSYRVIASAGQYSAGYLTLAFGARRPSGDRGSDSGTPIELADGARFDKVAIALPRGAAITGRVTDENGTPLARVQVSTLVYTPGSTRATRGGASAQTDDLGHFRLFGLPQGDFAIVAEAREPTFVDPNALPQAEDDQVGLMTTYYPGTPDEASAQRVRTKLGAELPGIEIRMAAGRLFRVSGTVTDSQGRAAPRHNGQLLKRTSGSTSSFGFNTDEHGRFQMRNIPPGSYRLVVRGRNGPAPPSGQQADPGEAVSVPVTINSDLEGLVVVLSPGAQITGQVVFEQGPPQLPPGQQSFQMRVIAAQDSESNSGLNSPQPGLVKPDLTFAMRGLHGALLLRSSGPGMYLKSVSVTGRDITDTPHEFQNGDQVTIVMTTRASTLEGTVSDAAGKPITEAAVLVFPDDKASWRSNSVRMRRGGVDTAGKYRVTGLLPGRYYAVALLRDRSILPSAADAEYYEMLMKDATPFVVGEDEQRQVDLKISTGAGG